MIFKKNSWNSCSAPDERFVIQSGVVLAVEQDISNCLKDSGNSCQLLLCYLQFVIILMLNLVFSEKMHTSYPDK